MSIGFRITVFSGLRKTPTSSDTKVDSFPSSSLQDQTEAETVAFGYPSRALVFEQRVRRPLAIRDMRRFVTAGDGLADQFRGEDFRSRLENGRSGFFGEPQASSVHTQGMRVASSILFWWLKPECVEVSRRVGLPRLAEQFVFFCPRLKKGSDFPRGLGV